MNGRFDPPGQGLLAVTITSLDMRAPPGTPPNDATAAAMAGMRIERAFRPSVPFYRFLYNTVGEDWLWSDRRRWTDDHLAGVVQHRDVELWVLHIDGQPAGFAELDGRQPKQTELAYFGLLPPFLGRGLGPKLLDFAARRAWIRPISRLWLHTCTFDHPAALETYCRCGFVPFASEARWVEDPRHCGLIRAGAAPHVPAAEAGP